MRTRILLLVGLLTACTSADKPKDLLPKEQMAQLLEEIHIVENQVNNLHLGSADSSLMVYKALEAQLFKRHQVDTARYMASFKYYVGHPDEFKTIYQQVTENLEKRNKQKKTGQNTGQPKKLIRPER